MRKNVDGISNIDPDLPELYDESVCENRIKEMEYVFS